MPYRRIELLAEDLPLDAVSAALEETEFGDLHRLGRDDGVDHIVLLLDEKLTEHAIDQLEDRFGHQDSFQLLVYDIAARLPRPHQDDEQGEQKTPEQSEKACDRISREELLDDLEPGSRVRWIYIAQVVISCIVAAVGMMRDSVAMVIAAMVIAPLLLPSMALALGTTVGDLRMMLRSVLTSAAGLGVGLAISLIIGLAVPFDPTVREIASRAEVRLSDLIVALAAGAAGAIAVTTGVSASLIGVMVAVALVPPLVAAGLFIGSGEFDAAGGSLILLASNIVCVNLAAVGVFLLQGIRPNRWAEQDRARLAVRNALVLWVVFLAILIALISFAAPDNPL